MKATIPYIEEKFHKYNNLCFEGKLPLPELRLSRATTFLGRMEYKRSFGFLGLKQENSGFVIKISNSRDMSEDELDDVIIHEMIHYFIAYFNIKDRSAHGPVFRSMMADINTRFGRHIRISHRRTPTEVQADAPVRERIVCVSEIGENELGVTVCSSTRVKQIRRGLPRLYRIGGMKWYLSSDPFFARYPRSNTPKIYRARQEELLKALENAVEIKTI